MAPGCQSSTRILGCQQFTTPPACRSTRSQTSVEWRKAERAEQRGTSIAGDGAEVVDLRPVIGVYAIDWWWSRGRWSAEQAAGPTRSSRVPSPECVQPESDGGVRRFVSENLGERDGHTVGRRARSRKGE